MTADYPKTLRNLIFMGLVALVAAGCAAPGGRLIAEAERTGNWDEALRLLTARTTNHPGDSKAWARLGEAQYEAGHYTDSRLSHEKALMLNDKLATSHLFLGLIAEREDNVDLALWHYQTFADSKPKESRAQDTVRRIEALRQKRAQTFAEHAIAEERNLSPSTFSDSTIGVVYFRSEQLADSLRPLAKGLAEMIVTDLSKVRALRVVERLQMDKLLAELQIANSVAFDSTTAPRLGKLLGAAHVLGGNLSDVTNARLRMDPQVVSSKTGDVTLGDDQVGELGQFFRMQKAMVFDVVARLGITLSDAERDSIGRLPTESLDAFLAYSRGLDFQDRGRYDDARREFNRARQFDPGFREANDHATQLRHLEGTEIPEPTTIETFGSQTTGETEWFSPPPATDTRLNALLDNTGLIRISTEVSGEGEQVLTPPEPGEATVIVRGRFDD